MAPRAIGRQFVDTKVLVYAHDRSAGEKRERARALLTDLWRSGDGCLSVQVLQEFYVAVTRRLAAPLSRGTARRVVYMLSSWTVHTPHPADVVQAIAIQERYDISFWDAMVVRSAAVLGCSVLWSEDLNAGQTYAGVEVRNPFAG